MFLFHRKREGYGIQIGFTVSKWTSGWELVACLPVFLWYSKKYYDVEVNSYYSGWRMWRFVLRLRTNLGVEPSGKQKLEDRNNGI